MKKTLTVMVIVMLLGAFSVFGSESNFAKGSMFLSPVLGVNSYAIPFGVNFETAITDNIGVGGQLLFQTWSEDIYESDYSVTQITPSLQAAYHFTKIDVQELDLYLGLNLGYSIVSVKWDIEGFEGDVAASSSLYLSPFVGARYYVSPKLAITANLQVSTVGDYTGFGGVVGVTFKLK